MQFFAYIGSQIIFAEEAQKGLNYRCPECHGRLRVKKGVHRRKHFFHLFPSKHCRQSQKSQQHLIIQKILIGFLPKDEAFLEKSFPAINRIADVFLESKGLIFEIQCSPISLEEVQNRMNDYTSLGYKVFWILHDKCFNRRKVSAAEAYLRPHHAIFTSINQKGQGSFYDQQESIQTYLRVQKGPPILINILDMSPSNRNPNPKKEKHPLRIKEKLCFFYYLILKKLIG